MHYAFSLLSLIPSHSFMPLHLPPVQKHCTRLQPLQHIASRHTETSLEIPDSVSHSKTFPYECHHVTRHVWVVGGERKPLIQGTEKVIFFFIFSRLKRSRISPFSSDKISTGNASPRERTQIIARQSNLLPILKETRMGQKFA